MINMDLTIINKKIYNEIINELWKNKDEKYRNHHQKLINDDLDLIGIRTPHLRELAKYISKHDYQGFIKYNTHKTYEERILHGLIIGYLKLPNKIMLEIIDEFLPYNTNWAINDIVCSNIKQFKKMDISVVNRYMGSNNPFTIRFGLTILLAHFINKENLDFIFNICDKVTRENYYIKMANAWLLSVCFVKHPEETYKYLRKNKLDKFTINKTISKICDSYRVGEEVKIQIKLLRQA